MKEVTKLEAGKTYKLINKKGFFDVCPFNTEVYSIYFNQSEENVRLTSVCDQGDGWVDKNVCVIEAEEIKFFALVEEKQPAPKDINYWVGDVPLEVDMVVREINFDQSIAFTVRMLEGEEVVLERENGGGLYITKLNDVVSFSKTHKEVFCDEVFYQYISSSRTLNPPNPFDIKEVAGICWEEFKGGSYE